MKLNIQKKLILLLLFFGLLPLVAIMPIITDKMSEMRLFELEKQKTVSEEIGQTIDRNLFERYGDVQAFGVNGALLDRASWYAEGDTPLQRAINSYMTNYGLYKLMLVLDLEGRVIATNTVAGTGKPLDTLALRTKTYQDQEWFKKAVAGEFTKSDTLSGTVVGEASYQPIIAEVYQGEDGFTIPFSAPFYDADGEVAGVWVNFADFGLVQDIVLATAARLTEQGKQEINFALIDRDGRLLIDYASKDGSIKRDRNVIGEKSVNDVDVPGQWSDFKGTPSGDKIIAASNQWPESATSWHHTTGALGFPGHDWTVITYQPTAEMFRSINATERLLWLICGGALLVLIVGGIIASRYASRPIRTIARQIETLSSGDYTIAISNTKRGDEIGEVANSMIKLRSAVEKNMDFACQISAMSKLQAVIEFEPTGTIITANDLFIKTVGYDLNEICGKHHSMFVDAAYRSTPDYKDFWERLAKGEPQIGECMRIAKSGAIIWLNAAYTPIVDPNGKVFKVVKFATDISKQKLAVSQINALIEKASGGELDARIDTSQFDGFYGEMTASMNGLMDAISTPVNNSVHVLEAFSRGDLSKRVEGDYRGAFATMQKALNESISHLADMVRKIMDAAQSVNAAAGEIASGSSDLSMRTEQQASSLEETAASMEEITGTVKENSINASNANELSAKANKVAGEGGQVVEQAVTAMASIEKSSQKISDIISVIDEIAFQTNLLALNAAVEAARAGEAGKGFAVVASEVRSLAGRSASASKEIKALISESVNQVKDGALLVNQAGDTLKGIITSVSQVASIVSEIASASEQQSNGIGEINSAVAQMDEVTQQNAALVEENTAAAQSMLEQAKSLESLISFFRLEHSDSEDESSDSPAIVSPVTASAGRKPVLAKSTAKPMMRGNGKANGHHAAPKSKTATAAKAVAHHDGWEEF